MSNVFNFRDNTNGGGNRFWVTQNDEFKVAGADVAGRETFDNAEDWLLRAVELYDGTVKSTGNVTGDVGANQIVVQDNAIVKLSGSNVGGQYRFQFDTVGDAENFSDFFTEMVDFLEPDDLLNPNGATAPVASTSSGSGNLFNFRDDTNGGGNRFWVTQNNEFKVAGADVAGRETFDNAEDWLLRAVELYDGTRISTGNVTGDIGASQIVVQDNAIVKLSGSNVGGQYRFRFDTVGDAENFSDFFTAMVDFLEPSAIV